MSEINRTARKRQRQREWYSRSKARDPVSYFSVPLPQSIVHQLIAGLKIKRSDDAPVSDREWRGMIAHIVAEIVKRAV